MEYTNILIIKMSSLGDVLHTLPFVAALRKRYPSAKITWLVHPQFADFIPDPPIVDEIIRFDRLQFRPGRFLETIRRCRELRRLLHSNHYDLVVDLQGLFKSAVVAWLSGCRNRIGTAIMREGSRWVSRRIVGPNAQGHAIMRSLDVARALDADGERIEFPMPNLDRESRTVRTMLTDLAHEIGYSGKITRYVVLVPGTRWETKCWPIEHYAELANQMVREGYDVVLAGGPDDREKSERIICEFNSRINGGDSESPAGVGQLFDLTGRTSLRELGALIKNAVFYISADTGPLHIAAALGVPLIALYGPTKVARTGPMGNERSLVVESPASCAGCLKKHCKHWHCMHDITPHQVLELFRQRIKAAP